MMPFPTECLILGFREFRIKLGAPFLQERSASHFGETNLHLSIIYLNKYATGIPSVLPVAGVAPISDTASWEQRPTAQELNFARDSDKANIDSI
jgi:hypothetical protein